MEKQANKLQSKLYINLFSTLVVLFALFFTLSAKAQTKKDTISNPNLSYENGKEYILGGITVTGLRKFSEETVKVFTGLRNGQLIKLPGDKLTSAIKKLYESKQCSAVDVYLSKIDGNTVYLQFDVVDLPKLNTATITSVILYVLKIFVKFMKRCLVLMLATFIMLAQVMPKVLKL